jgi:hypothetical protein
MSAFQGGFKRPGIMADLQAIVQKPAETFCSFMQRFCQVSHSIPDMEEAAVISMFSANVCDAKLREKTNTRRLATTNGLYFLADKCA